ncbi:MAG: branched-chain amino acid ABC transporter permease [Pusillimonas sp.]|jgi:branched-chain amino acid transport system permease protein|nr:branched-chain amino acid ABC transporter permease [Pusillimonas sp.]|tara:strand:- start:222763 stop:223743 length:981 start_codon:yes stop_codon:yes gene_type:complete
MAKLSLRLSIATAFLIALALVPVFALMAGDTYFITLFSRIMILGMAAVGLNLVLGFGGLVSLGHALYIGVGAYAVGILSFHGINNAWLQLLVALLFGGVLALVLGVVALRTKGLSFIMITLAFAQMAYYVAVGLRQYGGEDGLPLGQRSDFVFFGIQSDISLYYLIFVVLLATVYVLNRMIDSQFGLVLRGSKNNLKRMTALGYPILRYRLGAYLISALICVVSGFFLANIAKYVAPSYMSWHVSAEIIVMAVLGGMGTVLGPLIGATALLAFEEFLHTVNIGLPWGLDTYINNHFLAIIGIVILIIALSLQQGLYGSLLSREPSK